MDGIATLYPKDLFAVDSGNGTCRCLKCWMCGAKPKGKGIYDSVGRLCVPARDEPLIELSDVIKVEVDDDAKAWHNLRTISNKVDLKKCKLLAEKVESESVFEQAKSLGSVCFRGIFLPNPKP